MTRESSGWTDLKQLTAIAIPLSILIVAIGVAVSLARYGIPEAGLLKYFILNLAPIGIVVGGVLVLVKITVTSYSEAKKSPYQWLMPILAAAAAFVVDMNKEIYSEETVKKNIFAVITWLIFIGGGIQWRKGGLVSRSAAVFIFCLPSAFVVASVINANKTKGLPTILADASYSTVYSLVALAFVAIVIGFFSYATSKQD